MGAPRLEDYGLSTMIVDEVRARERRRLELFLKATGVCTGLLWLLLTALA
jgi:cell division protein FtsB